VELRQSHTDDFGSGDGEWPYELADIGDRIDQGALTAAAPAPVNRVDGPRPGGTLTHKDAAEISRTELTCSVLLAAVVIAVSVQAPCAKRSRSGEPTSAEYALVGPLDGIVSSSLNVLDN